jgi:hypothetical protein
MRKLLASIISACICAVGTARQFTVTTAYSGTLDNLHLRGSACGLNWNKGAVVPRVNSTHWSLDLQCKDTESLLEMKVLSNSDTNWMVGANHIVAVSPT